VPGVGVWGVAGVGAAGKERRSPGGAHCLHTGGMNVGQRREER
jgi:hypothetical protein